MAHNLRDKTLHAAYAERVGVVYLLEKRSIDVYNIFSYLVCSGLSSILANRNAGNHD